MHTTYIPRLLTYIHMYLQGLAYCGMGSLTLSSFWSRAWMVIFRTIIPCNLSDQLGARGCYGRCVHVGSM